MGDTDENRRERHVRRDAIVGEAAAMASLAGLDGLTFGALATRLGVSKSGLYAHFGSKEALQLAVLDYADARLDAEVIQPASAAPAGISRLAALTEAYLSYIERDVFPGGCLFRALTAEVSGRAGALPARAAAWSDAWRERLRHELSEAMAARLLDAKTDLDQVAFELDALLAAANASWGLTRDPAALNRARAGVEHVLGRVAR